MNCDTCQAQLMDALEASQGISASSAASTHLEGCVECREAWVEAQTGYVAFAAVPPLPPPTRAVEAVRKVVYADLVPARSATRRWPAIPVEAAMAAGFGMAAALASTLVLSARINLEAHSPVAIATGAILWTGAFIGAFWLILRKGPEARTTRELALCGLGAMVVFMGIDQFLPLTKVVHYCQADSWARGVLGPVGVKGLFFGLGSGYAMLPMFLLSLATGRRYQSGPLRGALLAGGLFFFLLAPAIFLQCRSFTIGALASWLAGSVLGALAGSAAGYWLNRRAFSAASA